MPRFEGFLRVCKQIVVENFVAEKPQSLLLACLMLPVGGNWVVSISVGGES